MAEQNNLNPAQATVGLNMDNIGGNPKAGELSYANNAVIQGFDSDTVSYQSEQSNNLKVILPQGYKVIGVRNITDKNFTMYLLSNPETHDSEIGIVVNGTSVYTTIVTDKGNDQKLNFDQNYPVRKIHPKTTNCSTQAFWTDGKNPRRYIDFDDLPWKEQINPDNDFKPIKLVGQLDVNKMNVQPNFDVPMITPAAISNGGRLKMGTYQFAIQYSNSLGDGYTSYYGVTNPVSIFEQKVGADPDAVTTKSITLDVSNLDTSGLWDYFNLTVIKTINQTPAFYKVGTFPITAKTFKYTYTGTNATEASVDPIEVFEQFAYYDTAQGSFEIDGIIGWYDLSYDEEINFQSIWSKIPVGWETWKVPYNQFEGYSNGINTANLKGGMRDEVYPLEGYFILRNGQRTRSFHIPGRTSNPNDLAAVSNTDGLAINLDPCDDPETKLVWQVYNTGSLTGYSPQYLQGKQDNCYVGPYQYGENAYWESQEKYPNNPDIWGYLANKPIRHHKLPDNLITNFHDNAIGDLRSFEHSIFPIGFRIPDGAIEAAIEASNLSANQKSMIVGWGIARGNRQGGNKSIIAKGIFNNVGKYKYNPDATEQDVEEEFFYPNYPFNDLRPDPYFATQKLKSHSGYLSSLSLEGFGDHSRSRFTFHSPDTHFFQTTGINSGSLKIESIEYGESYGHFQKVIKNAEYKFLSKETFKAAAGIAAMSGLNLGAGTFGSPTINLAPVPSTFVAARELFEKLIPYTNFGYTFHSTGYYGKSYPVPNDGNKIRSIDYGKYIIDGKENVEEGKLINNFRRESSVYLSLRDKFLFPQEYNSTIPEDNSRYTLSSVNNTGYNVQVFLDSVVATNGSVVTNEDIEEEISAYSVNPGGQSTAVVIFQGTITTVDLPETGDIYKQGSINYVITKIELDPVDATNTNYIITASVIDYNSTTFTAPPSSGSLTLVYGIAGSASTSAAAINYTAAETSLPDNSSVYNVAGVRNDVEAFAGSFPTLDDYYNLLTGTDSQRLLYFSLFNAYQRISLESGKAETPDKIRKSNICSYYGSIKAYLPSQWGQIYSYETIDTGYRTLLGTPNTTIFGGDIYINRFALKTKVPIFLDNTFGDGDQTDIEYDYLGNYGHPMFWISTRPEDLKIDIQKEIDKVIKILENSPFINGDGSTLGKIWTAIKGIISGGFLNAIPVLALLLKIFKEVVRTVGINNINLDNYKLNGLQEEGIYYMYVYGVPYYFVESEINVDYRQATNPTDGNFYPNVGGGIPDDWLQEVNTPIINDNKYSYNETYNKQNKETYFTHLREDYDPAKKCFYKYPNRAIWAEQSNVEETKNHWLVYRPTARFDLPKSYGDITSLDGIENRQILTRYRNRTQIHNALTTIETSVGPSAYLATPKLFSTQPIDLSATDSGQGGSQNVLLLRTEFGHIYTDTQRGSIILLRGNQPQEISDKGMDKWFNHYLNFFIQDIEGVKIDNAFKDIGITGVYDGVYKRAILTKKDYEPLVQGITYNEEGEFIFNDKVISLTDSNYFCDRSFTLSYSFITQSWTSFHSYQPNYYIEQSNYFQTGINNEETNVSSVWNHNLDFTSFHNYYGTTYPYIIEFPYVYKLEDEILQNIKDLSKSLKYTDYETFSEPDKTFYFSKAIIYNNQQCTGILELEPKKGLSSYGKYPIYKSDSKVIQLTKSDSYFNFNTFWNITIDPDVPIWNKSCSLKYSEKLLNKDNLNYQNKSFTKAPLRARNCWVRLISDKDNTVRLISRFILSPSIDSKK